MARKSIHTERAESFHSGYQQALYDLHVLLNEGGEDAAREWISNNLTHTGLRNAAGI